MKSTKWIIPFAISLIGLVLTIILFTEPAMAGSTNVIGTTVSHMTEYSIPITLTNSINGEPRHIIIQDTGHLWFTLPASNQIGELMVTSTVDYQFYTYDIPTVNSEPNDLVYDGNTIWFTAKVANQIGQLDIVNKTITMHNIPTLDSMPSGITKTPDGRIWFVNSASNKLAFFSPDTPDIITEYQVSCTSGIPPHLNDIATKQDDSIWLTAPDCNRVFEFSPNTGTFEGTPVGIFGESFSPGTITIGHHNEPWITAPSQDVFGLYHPGTLAYWRWYNTISEQAGLADIFFTTFDSLDYVWVIESNTNRVGLLLTTLTSYDNDIFRESQLPTVGSMPHSIVVDSANHAWITASGANKIVEWSPPYFFYTYLPLILK